MTKKKTLKKINQSKLNCKKKKISTVSLMYNTNDEMVNYEMLLCTK